MALRSAEVESWVLWSDATVNVDVKLERHDLARDESSPRWPSVPRLLWSGASPAPRRRLHHCGAAAAASRHAAPPAPRRDQARRRPATRPPAPLRVQVQHARPPPVEPAEPFGLKAPTAASRSPMHAALARSPEPAPAGGRARCWPRPPTAGQLSGRARGAERLPAAQRRPKKNLGLVGHRENQIRHGGRHQSVLRGKPFL
mgnify:CR=1 FL=1